MRSSWLLFRWRRTVTRSLCRLTVAERASVIDVPILVQDVARCMGLPGEEMLMSLAASHPGKVLHLGTDQMLTMCAGGLGYDRTGDS